MELGDINNVDGCFSLKLEVLMKIEALCLGGNV